jgi:hypothetical protein
MAPFSRLPTDNAPVTAGLVPDIRRAKSLLAHPHRAVDGRDKREPGD